MRQRRPLYDILFVSGILLAALPAVRAADSAPPTRPPVQIALSAEREELCAGQVTTVWETGVIVLTPDESNTSRTAIPSPTDRP